MTDDKVELPKNGLLSGMIITAVTGAFVIPLGLLVPSFRARFAAPMSLELMHLFFASLVLMAAHKVESYWFKEYEQCPVYLTSGRASWAQDPKQAIFVSFVTTFIG